LRQSISEALEGAEDVGTWGGGYPFDVEQVRIAPGAATRGLIDFLWDYVFEEEWYHVSEEAPGFT
jgi:hypothetical protein